jgi:peptidoglycan/LPS O-acetylase OafA/YrhL
MFLVGGILLSILYRLWAADHFAAAPEGAVFLAASHLPGYLPEFLLGASAALLVQWFELRRLKAPPAWSLDALFLIGATFAALWFWRVVLPNGDHYWSGHWSMVIAPLALGLPLSMMVISCYWGSRIGRLLFANPVVYFIGLISYSLYLWHFVVLQQAGIVFGEAFTNAQGLPKFLISLILVLLAASISYFLFERPFFRLGARRKTGTGT